MKCKYCPKWKEPMVLEKWDKNLYLAKCSNPNHVRSVWLEWQWRGGRWQPGYASVKKVDMPTMNSAQKKQFDDLQVPFWKLLGQKAKPKDIALEKELKRRGMTYGDWRLERDIALGKFSSASAELENHFEKHGVNDAPAPSFQKVD